MWWRHMAAQAARMPCRTAMRSVQSRSKLEAFMALARVDRMNCPGTATLGRGLCRPRGESVAVLAWRLVHRACGTSGLTLLIVTTRHPALGAAPDVHLLALFGFGAFARLQRPVLRGFAAPPGLLHRRSCAAPDARSTTCGTATLTRGCACCSRGSGEDETLTQVERTRSRPLAVRRCIRVFLIVLNRPVNLNCGPTCALQIDSAKTFLPGQATLFLGAQLSTPR